MAQQRLVRIYPINSESRWLRQPDNLADIRNRRANGESFAAIAREYNVTRERVRQVCAKESIPDPNWDELYAKGVELIKSGVTLAQVMADHPDWSRTRLKEACARAGVATDQTSRASRRWSGAQFGMWTVIGEFQGREDKSSRILCRCECGTERMVSLHALKTKNTMGCGCRNSNGGRQVTPWICVETGDVFPNTYRAAVDAEVTPTCLHLANRKGRDRYVSSKNGKTYLPLRELSISHEAFMTNLKKKGPTVEA